MLKAAAPRELHSSIVFGISSKNQNVFMRITGEYLPGPIPGAVVFSTSNLLVLLEEEINLTIRPFFQSIDTIEAYVAYTNDLDRFRSKRLFVWPLRRCLVKLALGDLEGAREVIRLTEPKAMIASDYFRKMWPGVYERLKYDIAPLLEADDRAGIIRYLHAAERRSVENIGVAHWHEVTPFPIERQSG